MYTASYQDEAQAQAAMKTKEALGHRVMHEDYAYKTYQAEDGVLTVLDSVTVTYDDAPDNTHVAAKDWKADYAAADTTTAKLDILAQRLGLK